MGRDKALLPIGGVALVAHVASVVREATGSATLVGPRERYGSLGLPLIEDEVIAQGPLAGIVAALTAATGERILIVACDMPWLSAAALKELLAVDSDADAVVALSHHGREPLCAVYHRRCLPVFADALRHGELTVRRVIERLRIAEWPLPDPRLVTNINTPADWATVRAAVCEAGT